MSRIDDAVWHQAAIGLGGNIGDAAAAIAETGVPVFAVKGETLEEYWDYVVKIFDWGQDETCNLILDDGGDATMFALWGARVEAGETLFDPTNEE